MHPTRSSDEGERHAMTTRACCGLWVAVNMAITPSQRATEPWAPIFHWGKTISFRRHLMLGIFAGGVRVRCYDTTWSASTA